jgi:hypothetical protein
MTQDKFKITEDLRVRVAVQVDKERSDSFTINMHESMLEAGDTQVDEKGYYMVNFAAANGEEANRFETDSMIEAVGITAKMRSMAKLMGMKGIIIHVIGNDGNSIECDVDAGTSKLFHNGEEAA